MVFDLVVVIVAVVAGGVIVLALRPSYRVALDEFIKETFYGEVRDQFVKKTANGLFVEKDGVVSQIVFDNKQGGLKRVVRLADKRECRPFVLDLAAYNTGHFKDPTALVSNPSEAVFVYDNSQSKLNEISRIYGDTRISGGYDSESDADQRAVEKLDRLSEIAAKMREITGKKARDQ